jgi:hypothetical protein
MDLLYAEDGVGSAEGIGAGWFEAHDRLRGEAERAEQAVVDHLKRRSQP